MKFTRMIAAATLTAAAATLTVHHFAAAQQPADQDAGARLVTGKSVTPIGNHVQVGSYPQSGVLTADGKYFLVSDSGSQEYLSAVRSSDGTVASQVSFNSSRGGYGGSGGGTDAPPATGGSGQAPAAAPTVLSNANLPAVKLIQAPAGGAGPGIPATPGQPPAAPRGRGQRPPAKSLYFGLALYPTSSGSTVYASGGAGGLVTVLNVDTDGKLTDSGKSLTCPDLPRPVVAGLALSADGGTLYAADNRADPGANMGGTLIIWDIVSGVVKSRVQVPGYPYAVAAVTKGEYADKKVYVSSEQRGSISVIDPAAGKVVGQISTGLQPIGLLLDSLQDRLFVANAGSDTISVINTKSDKIVGTILLRPVTARNLVGATPIGMTFSPDEKTLYVSLADMNAVAVVDVAKDEVRGYLPTGWYPTGIAATGDGKALLVTEARGVALRTPGQGGLRVLRGVASRIDLSSVDLQAETTKVYANNLDPVQPNYKPNNPGIKHIIYIIKENRTYDQILGDDPRGNGDASECMFGKDVTPNIHALADRFVLLDNFYDCAEVSGDGWNWSTAGMASEYVSRNVPYSYGGRGRSYDYEGTNNGVPVDLQGIPDAAAPPGGYIWDDAAKHHISQRDYGFFCYDIEPPRSATQVSAPGGGTGERSVVGEQFDVATKKVLGEVSDHNFRDFDTSYHDSDAWVTYKLPLGDREKASYGAFKEPSRYSEWKREFDGYVKDNNLPQFTMLRLMMDHTGGGDNTPSAQVSDNDYAVGEVVDAVSKSSYWKSTAIVVVEDDSQSGYDHVDCHRSLCLVVSPFVERGARDSRFYNTDSALKTIEVMLGLPPLNQFDSIAAPVNDFTKTPDNAEPYNAILPAKEIIGEERNEDDAAAVWTNKNIDEYDERSGPDLQLNSVLWREIMHTNPPPIHHSVQFGPTPKDADGDNDGDG
jgi:YVTN family beta-propeller protein